MTRFKMGGRELALAFTIGAMDRLEERLGEPIELESIKETIVAQLKDRHKLVTILAILSAEGAALDGGEAVDEAWLKQHVRPGMLPRAQMAVLEAVADGLRMESGEGDEDEEVDAVLEELKKKPAQGA